VALACAYGAWRIHGVDAAVLAAPRATVGVVQADMGLMEKRTEFDEGLSRHLQLSSDLEQRDGVDFLVWSETSVMRAVREETYRQELRAGVGERVGAPSIFGVVIFKRVPDEREFVLFNAAVSSDIRGTI